MTPDEELKMENIRLREENAALTKERDAGLAMTHCPVCGSDTANTNESTMNVELTRLRGIAERCGDVEGKLRTCHTEIIPLKDGGWEVYADYGENSSGHIKSDSSKSLWDVLSEIDNPFHQEGGECRKK